MVLRTAESKTVMEPSNEYLMSLSGDSDAHWKLEKRCTKAWNSFAFPGEKNKISNKSKIFAFLPRKGSLLSFHMLPARLVLLFFYWLNICHQTQYMLLVVLTSRSVCCVVALWDISSQNVMPSFTSLLSCQAWMFKWFSVYVNK